MPKISKETLSSLYAQHKNIHKIGNILNVSGNTISRWLKQHNIEILGDSNKYNHIRNIPLTKDQNSLIIGSLLGDGSIQKCGRICFSHSLAQLDYLIWKKDILGALVQQNINYHIQKTRNSILATFNSITHPEIKEYRKLFYADKKIIPTNIKDLIDPFSVAGIS